MGVSINKNAIIIRLLCAFLAAAVLVAAALMSGCSVDSKKWVLSTVRDHYYFYDEMDKEGLENLTIEEIVSRLDKYSAYYTAEEYDAVLKDYGGEKAGIGFSYMYLKEGNSVYPEGGCLIALVVGNSPAEAAGMKAGIVLKSGTYNGNTVSFKEDGALDGFISPIAANVRFTLTDTDGNEYEVSKQEYISSYMFMATSSTAYTPTFSGTGKVSGLKEVPGRAISYLPENTAYVSMSQFFGTAADEFGHLMTKFNAEGCTSLILDLRSNGGGYVDVMCDMAGYFTSSLSSATYVAMTAEYKSGYNEIYNCKSHSGGGLVSKDTTVYLLANSETASASEALIGVLVDYGFLKTENIFLSEFSEEFTTWADGSIPSGRSYGKGIMQSPFRNWMTGEVLKLTTARILWPNGKCIHGVGVTPQDGCRTVQADWIVTPEDTELQRVVEMIKG